MAVIGVAEVPVRPTFRGLQKSVGKEFDGVGQTMERTQGRSLGQRLMSGIGTGLKVGAAVVGTATAGILTTALVKGWQRLTAIENAEAKLKGLGHSAGDVSKIMDNALASVKGTAFGMDEAATTAASAVAANIKPGKDLEDVLRLTADAATIAGTDMASMGSIFNKVAGSNKIQGDSIAQLHDAGIPVVQMLAKEMGTSVEETYKLASAGKINFATFRAAMEDGLGGAALSAGDTTTGAFNNMMAALSRFGAQLLVGVFPLAKHVFGGITTLIDDLTTVAEPVVTSLSQGMVDGLKTLGDAWNGTSNDVQQSGFMGFLQGFGSTARSVFDSVSGWISRFRDNWKESADTVQGTGLAGFFERFSTAAGGSSNAASVAGGILESLGKILSNIAEVLPGLVQSGLSAFATALEWISGNMHIILPLLAGAVVVFTAWRVAMAAVRASMFSLQAAQLAMTPVITMNNLLRLAAIRGEQQHAIATGKASAADFARARSLTAKTTVLGRATLAQRGLNTAMRANPIGAIITGITLLVAALVWFFTQTETGQKIFTSAWEGIKNVVGGVVDWFQHHVVGTFKQIYSSLFKGDFIGGGALAEDSPVVTFIFKLRDAAKSVAGWFTGTFVPAMKSAWNGVAAAATWAWDNVLSPVFTAVATVAKWVWSSVIKPVFGFIGAAWQTLASVFQWWWNGVMKPVFTLAGDIIKWLWVSVAQPMFARLGERWASTVAGIQSVWTNTLKPVFNFVGAIITWLWVNVAQPYFRSMWERFQTLGRFFSSTWTGTIRPMIDSFGNWVKRLYNDYVKPALGWISDRWDWLSGRISGFWNDKLKPIFQAVGDFVKNDVVDMVKDGVSMIDTAWRKVANFFRKPINSVIDFVWNDGIKAMFDSVAKAVQSDARLAEIKKIPAFAKGGRHSGGWALVGEEGPELVDFKTPGRVYTAGQTKKALGQGDVSPGEHVHPMGGFGSWIKDSFSAAVDWTRGFLAERAETLIKPIRESVAGYASEFGSMGKLGGGLVNWGLDQVMDWIRGKDAEAVASSGGGYEFDGPMISGGVHRPANGPITSRYGMRGGRLHGGIDFAGPLGSAIYAIRDGVVHSIQNYSGSGLSVNLSHGGGSYSHYGHGMPGGIPVSPGQSVKAGQQISTIGMTGRTTGPHVHLETWQGGLWNRTNPNNLFRDNGGLIYPGLNAVLNQDRRPEYTFNERDFKDVRDIVRGGGRPGGPGGDYHYHAHSAGSQYQDASDWLLHTRRLQRVGV